MLNQKSRKSWRGPTWANIGPTYKTFFFGANMFSGIWGENVGAGQHRLHGLREWGQKFSRDQHDIGNFGQKCWPAPTLFTWTTWVRNKFWGPTKFGANIVWGICAKNVGADQHRSHGPGDAEKNFFGGQHGLRNLGQKCWRGPTSFTWTFYLFFGKLTMARLGRDQQCRINVPFSESIFGPL